MHSSDFLPTPTAQGLLDGAKVHPSFGDEQIDDDSPDTHRNAPQPDPICLYGLVGDVARAGSDGTETNAHAIAANFMAYLSCAVGRGVYLPVGNTRHHARLFCLHIGRSGRGRKGDASAKSHSNFKRMVNWPHESGFRYVFHANGDSNRELIVTVLVFHVPK